MQIMTQVIGASLGRNIVRVMDCESQPAARTKPVHQMVYGMKHFCFAGVSKDRRSDYVIEPGAAGIRDRQVYDTGGVKLEVVTVVENEVGPGTGLSANLNCVS